MLNKIKLLTLFFAVILISACKIEKDSNSAETLHYSIAETIPVSEPSGLDLSFDEKAFWIVSDNNSTVYLIDSWGREIKSFRVDGEDLEGITVIDSIKLAVILERSREVLIIDTSGVELKRIDLNLTGDLNSGPEGITYDPDKKRFYILNEKNPVLLMILDEELNEISRDTLDFLKDASGIYVDTNNEQLWILSDENQMIVKTDFTGKVSEKFKIKIRQPEGITLKKDGTQMFIVSDFTNSLYVFNLE